MQAGLRGIIDFSLALSRFLAARLGGEREEALTAVHHGIGDDILAALRLIGKSVPRRDGRAKVTGAVRFTVDVKLPGMLHARILRSPHAHARIKSIDAAPAEKVAGFRAVHFIVQAGAEMRFAGAEGLRPDPANSPRIRRRLVVRR